MLEEPSREAGQWVRRQSTRAKVGLGAILDVVIVVLSWLLVKDHDYIFIAAESAHVAGVSVLIYKLLKNRTCSGHALCSHCTFCSSIYSIQFDQLNLVGILCLPGICVCSPATTCDADCQACAGYRAIYSSLCIFARSCLILELCTLDAPDYRHLWIYIDNTWICIVALSGCAVRDHPDLSS